MSPSLRQDQIGQQIGRRVHALRVTRGWSQRALAERAGIHANTLERLENGESRDPTVSACLRLAQAFGVPLCELAGQVPSPTVDAAVTSAALIEENSRLRESLRRVARLAEESAARERGPWSARKGGLRVG